jgi:Uma2 family endonuclease
MLQYRETDASNRSETMSVKQMMTIEDLREMPEKPGVRYELADGELIEVSTASVFHMLVTILTFDLLRDFAREQGLGSVYPDGIGYVLSSDPPRMRVPDVSFVSRDRIPTTGIPDGFWPEAPDLAVEIVSPNDRAESVHAKVGEYLAAGTRTVWVLWPSTRSATVHHAGGRVQELGPDRNLDGGDVLPGFSVRVGDLFDVKLGP